jgi:hypothetical protein
MKRRSDDIAKVLGMASEWKPLKALGPYYGKSWFVTRPGEGAFSQVLNRTPEEAAKAKRRLMPPNLETYAAALTRDEIDPSLLYPSLDSHCPRCTQVHDPGHRRFSEANCAVLSHDGPKEGFVPCKYIYCYRLSTHARSYCPKINLRCFHCLRRGHAADDGVCEDEINLELLEEAAGMGWVTENRFRKEGAASGFYPVLTLPQIRHIDNMGGYSRMLAMSVKEATQLTEEGAQLHSQWVGAEPSFTQAAARVGYLGATNDAEYAAYVGELMNAGENRKRRIRPAINFRARFVAPDDVGTCWGDEVD